MIGTKVYKITGEGDDTTIAYTPLIEEAEIIAKMISDNGYYPHVVEVAMCAVPAAIRKTW